MTEEEGSRKRKKPDATGGTEHAEEWKKLTGLTLPKHGKIVPGKGSGNYDAFVSSHGRIKRVHVNTKVVVWTTGSTDTHRYKQVRLLVKGEAEQNASSKLCKVHQLVYLAFHHVDGEEWPEHVRHLDGDLTNNRRENIAGGTMSENQQDSIRHGTKSGFNGESVKRVKQIDKTTGDLIATHLSVSAAAHAVRGDQGTISNCCLGKRRTHGGFRWEYD